MKCYTNGQAKVVKSMPYSPDAEQCVWLVRLAGTRMDLYCNRQLIAVGNDSCSLDLTKSGCDVGWLGETAWFGVSTVKKGGSSFDRLRKYIT